jgi:hypothetical protein
MDATTVELATLPAGAAFMQPGFTRRDDVVGVVEQISPAMVRVTIRRRDGRVEHVGWSRAAPVVPLAAGAPEVAMLAAVRAPMTPQDRAERNSTPNPPPEFRHPPPAFRRGTSPLFSVHHPIKDRRWRVSADLGNRRSAPTAPIRRVARAISLGFGPGHLPGP